MRIEHGAHACFITLAPPARDVPRTATCAAVAHVDQALHVQRFEQALQLPRLIQCEDLPLAAHVLAIDKYLKSQTRYFRVDRIT